MKKILIVGINGSPNIEGTGTRLIKEVLTGAEYEGAETGSIYLANWIQKFHNGDLKSHPEQLKAIYELMKASDGFVFSTPVQWFSVSDLMTSFINHLTALEIDDFALEGKVVGFIATCNEDGGQAACAQMMSAFTHMGCLTPPYATLYYNTNMAEKSEKGWQSMDTYLMGQNLVRLAKATRKIKWGYSKKL